MITRTHTIKGATNSTGLADVGRMIHSVEDALEKLRTTDGAMLGILLPRITSDATERDGELLKIAGQFEASAE